jgi:hypothetical protein
MNEKQIQSVVMFYALGKGHQFALINNTSFFMRECDVLSATQNGHIHEYEIKISLSDYRRDFKKFKHAKMENGWGGPSAFWFVTPHTLAVEVPQYAGWITVWEDFSCQVEKQAPKLAQTHMMNSSLTHYALRSLSYSLAKQLRSNHIKLED